MRPRLLLTSVIAVLAVGAGGCGDDAAEIPAAADSPLPDGGALDGTTSSAPVSTAPPTTTTSPSAGLEFSFTDGAGYTFDAHVEGIELSESVATSRPGEKKVWITDGTLELTNTTPSRIAPAPSSFEVTVAIPADCAPGLTCQDGFKLLIFALLNASGAGSIPVGGTGSYEPRVNAESMDFHPVPESLSTDSFYWTIREPGGSDKLLGGWAAHGAPPEGAPTFTVRTFE